MATIPMGNFGQSVAQPQRATRAVANTGAAEALGQVAQTVQGIALDQMASQTRLDQEAREVEAQTNAGRVRVKTINDASDLSDEISRGILDGTISKDKATEEWSARFKELTNGRLDGMDPRYAGPLQVAFEDLQARGLNGVRDTLTKRGQQDTQANLLTLGEEYQRMAAKDRPRAVLEYTAQLEAMGPKAGWGPQEIALKKQQFREGTAYTQATALVGSARDLNGVRKAREALSSDSFADLDPQRRAQIEATLEGRETTYLQRQEIAAQRAQRQAEARLSRAEAAFKAGQSLIDAGIPLAPEEYDRLAATTSGTPFAGALQQLQTRAREVGGFAAQPIKVQQAALDQVNAQIAQQGASESLVKRRDSLQRVLEGSRRDFGEDPLRAGLQRGVITDLQPVDLRSVDGAVKSLQGRMQAASVVQSWAGRPTSPLTTDEAQQLGTMLQSLRPDEKARAIATISALTGSKAAQALASQIESKDRALALGMALGTSMTTGESNWLGQQTIAPRPAATLLFAGQQYLKDRTGKIDPTLPAKMRDEAATYLADSLAGKAREDVIEAAVLINHGFLAEGQGADMQRATRLAVGGNVLSHNGKKIPVAPGMTTDRLRDRLGSITPQAISAQLTDGKVYAGGRAIDPAQFTSSLPGATLEPAGMGQYYVRSGAGVAKNGRGEPIKIEVR